MAERTTGASWARRVASKLGGEAGVWVFLRQPGGISVRRVQEAVEAANTVVPARSTVGSFVAELPRGIAVLVHANAGMARSTDQWVVELERALVSQGVNAQGSIMRSARTGESEAVELRDRQFPAAFIGYQMSTYNPLAQSFNGWQVDESATRRVAERSVEWLSSIETGHTWAQTMTTAPVTLNRAADFLMASSALSAFGKQVQRVGDRGYPTLSVTLGQLGEAVVQECDPSLDWAESIDRQTTRLCADADLMDVGLIKHGSYLASSWTDLEDRTHGDGDVPVRYVMDYERSRHLWDEYVIDVAGVQLLTSKHLTHAHDLSDWIVDEVAHERFLVRAQDLAPWYAGEVRDVETVSRARENFGNMILSWDAILAKPGPYTITDSRIVGR